MADADPLAANAVAFGGMLRRGGLAVDPGQTAAFLAAMRLVGVADRAAVKAAGRAIYVHRREERAVYDLAFDLFWRRRGPPSDLPLQLPRIRQGERSGLGADLPPGGAGEVDESEFLATARPGAASLGGRARHADFGTLSPEEARDAQAMLEALRPRLAMRPARRARIARSGGRLALRTMLRRSLGAGGETVVWRWHRRRARPRPVVLICDISGSMERYSRFLLRFAHALARSGAPLEVFVFGTRLTRITRQLRVRRPDDALRRVAASVVDWSGGTRIGESLHELNRRWVRRTVRSGAVVLLVSDGWERGDPDLLRREMATLQRSCHRLLWLDPLASRPGFEPATAGLQAALPFVDDFLPCASVASLEELATRLATLGRLGARRTAPGRPAGPHPSLTTR